MTDFGNFPDMIKLQVLEFLSGTREPFIWDYSIKTKAIVRRVNPAFLKEVLLYKINNPPEYFCNAERSHHHIIITTPTNIENYRLIIGKINVLQIHSKYWKMITETETFTSLPLMIGDSIIAT
jgi:hypothetical protein